MTGECRHTRILRAHVEWEAISVWRWFMNRLCRVFILSVAIVGCGGGSGAGKQTAEGGGAGSSGSGGDRGVVLGSGGVGGGGTAGVQTAGSGGSTGSSAGAGGVAGSVGDAAIADARVSNADQPSAMGDALANGSSCPAFTACGGNLVGTWHAADPCGITVLSSSGCSIQIVSVDRSASQSTWTFGSGGTFAYTYSGTVKETLGYPIECIRFGTDAGIAQACDGFQSAIQSSMQAADAGASSPVLNTFTCTVDVNQTCLCNAVYSFSAQTATGFFTTSGHQVTITTTAGSSLGDAGIGDAGADSSGPDDYCVSGNTLTIQMVDSSGTVSQLKFTK